MIARKGQPIQAIEQVPRLHYPATSVFLSNSADSMMYWHSTPREGRRPLTRTNRELSGNSWESTSINNSPAPNLSRLREVASFASNDSVTLRFVFNGNSNRVAAGLPAQGPPMLHFGEGCRSAFDRGSLIFTPDRADHGFHMRDGSSRSLIHRNQRRRTIHYVGPIAFVERPGHLMHLVQTLAA